MAVLRHRYNASVPPQICTCDDLKSSLKETFAWVTTPSFNPPSLGHSPGGLLLSVDVDNVLHQQVPLEAIDSMAVQHHLMAARRTAKATATGRRTGGTTGMPQRIS